MAGDHLFLARFEKINQNVYKTLFFLLPTRTQREPDLDRLCAEFKADMLAKNLDPSRLVSPELFRVVNFVQGSDNRHRLR